MRVRLGLVNAYCLKCLWTKGLALIYCNICVERTIFHKGKLGNIPYGFSLGNFHVLVVSFNKNIRSAFLCYV